MIVRRGWHRWLVIVSIVLLVGWAIVPAFPVQAESGQRLVLAFYYAWFDENTWTPDKVPDFPLEPYVSRDRQVMARHIEQAKAAGIDAFVVSWYGPQVEFNQTETNFAAMLDEAAARGFSLAVDFEVRSPFFHSQADVVAALRYLLERHAKHPGYLRWQGKPVIFFWRNEHVFRPEGQSAVDAWRWIRDQVDPQRQSLWIAEGVDTSYLEVFDGHHLYTVTWNPPTDPAYTAAKFSRLVRQTEQRLGQDKLWIATVMPGWDSTKAGRPGGFVRPREEGAYYARTWEAALASAPDWIIITSFNEWREGTYIEPSRAYGDLYLRLTAEWTARFKSLPDIQHASPVAAAAPASQPSQAAPEAIKPPRPAATPTPWFRPWNLPVE